MSSNSGVNAHKACARHADFHNVDSKHNDKTDASIGLAELATKEWCNACTIVLGMLDFRIRAPSNTRL